VEASAAGDIQDLKVFKLFHSLSYALVFDLVGVELEDFDAFADFSDVY
jgi:hypothetical protein